MSCTTVHVAQNRKIREGETDSRFDRQRLVHLANVCWNGGDFKFWWNYVDVAKPCLNFPNRLI